MAAVKRVVIKRLGAVFIENLTPPQQQVFIYLLNCQSARRTKDDLCIIVRITGLNRMFTAIQNIQEVSGAVY